MLEPGGRQFSQSYNCQAVVDSSGQMLVAARATNQSSDKHQAVDMMKETIANTGEVPVELSADAGYYSARAIRELSELGVEPFVTPDKTRHVRKLPPATPLPAPTAPPAPTPTDKQRRIQTPMNFGSNTRVVDGDIHVWHIPTCQPVPPATWVASVILTDLRSGSNLHLNRDGSVLDSPAPNYRSDEGRDRLAEVLEDSSLMELILAPMECP